MKEIDTHSNKILSNYAGSPNKRGIREGCSVCCIVNVEFRILIPNSYENWDQYVLAKYRAIFVWYQGPKT